MDKCLKKYYYIIYHFEIFAVDGIIHPSNIKGHGKDGDTLGLSINDLLNFYFPRFQFMSREMMVVTTC